MFWESQRTRRTQSKRRRGGPCVRVKRTSGPGAWRGMAGFARHALGKGADAPTAQHGVFRRCRRCRRYRSAADAALHNGFACRPAGALRGRGRFGPSGLHAPFSVAVEGLALCACTLRSPGRLCRPLAVLPAVAGPKSAQNLRNLRFPTALVAKCFSTVCLNRKGRGWTPTPFSCHGRDCVKKARNNKYCRYERSSTNSPLGSPFFSSTLTTADVNSAPFTR